MFMSYFHANFLAKLHGNSSVSSRSYRGRTGTRDDTISDSNKKVVETNCWILKKLFGKAGTELVWFRIGTSGGLS